MGSEVEAEELRKDERILRDIDKCIDSRNYEYQTNKEILRKILADVFATIIGRDLFFREHYKGFFFIKNHYRGLKVGKTEEFDVNIKIKIPLLEGSMMCIQGEHLYLKLRWPNDESIYTQQWRKHKSFLSTWLIQGTSGEFLLMDKNAFQSSIGSLLARAMLNVPKIDNYTIKVHKTGPPFTLSVKRQALPEWKVNLVPVVPVKHTSIFTLMNSSPCYAVPEVLQHVEDEHVQWAKAYYHHDLDLLSAFDYIKLAVRRVEKLRDTQQWNVIPSYHIKALFMQYVVNFEIGDPLQDIYRLTGIKFFIHILDELRNMCKFCDLKNHRTPRHNLVDPDEGQLAAIAEQLTVMIREISDDPAKLADWLFTSEELSEYEKELNAIRSI